jgi:excisionase family DNA binding protein
MSVWEAADLYRVSPTTIKTWVRWGSIPGVTTVRGLRLPRKTLTDMLCHPPRVRRV